jgi:protease I
MASIPNDKDVYQPETANYSAPHAILMITADDVEDLEFFYPYYRFIEAGYKVDVATPKGGAFKGKNGLGLTHSRKITEVAAEDYDLLYLPGGKAPAVLKKDENVIAVTQHFIEMGKTISAICHGPQILAAAGAIAGRKIAAWPEVEEEVREAGASYVNQETVTDGLFITARWPGDLPKHMKETLAALGKSGKASATQAAA